jgi:thiamine-phosphate pyrophosphorylase
LPAALCPSKLYAILDLELTRARAIEPLGLLDAWLVAGVRLVQLRAKGEPSGALLDLADKLAPRVRAAGGRFIVNDRVDIARMAAADGVHLGQTDLSPRAARTILGSDAIVGLSTHNHAQVVAGLNEPVSYLAIGPVFATATKGDVEPLVGLDGVRMAAALAAPAGLPVVAIGGITLASAPSVIAAGAASVAVISDLAAAAPGPQARAFLDALA